MIIKSPPGFDTSHYETIADFSALSPKPMVVITKATESTNYVDPTFSNYMHGIQTAGYRRGCYHFFRNAYSSVTQATHFINTVKNVIDDKDIIVLDVEESGTSAAQIISWFQNVMAVYPNNLYMIYSRKNILDPISVSAAQASFLKLIKVWTAGYPTYPDSYSYPPASYIPDQTKWGPVWMWQYSKKGVVSGVVGNIDLNWLSPQLIDWLTNVPENTTESWFNGAVTYSNGWITGSRGSYFKYHITKIEKTRVEKMFVTKSPLYVHTTGYVAQRDSVDILSNGGEAIYTSNPALPKGQSVSEGTAAPLAPVSERFLSMQWDANMNFLGFLVDKFPSCYWAIGISDILLEDGVVPKEFDNYEADPRSTLFWNDTHWMFIHIDGRNNGTPGAQLPEVGDFARGLGMKHGGNLDGGDSSTLVYLKDGVAVVKNNPPEGFQHQLADHIGFKINGGAVVPTEKWIGTVIANSLGVWAGPYITANAIGTRKKDDEETGELVTSKNGKVLFLQFALHKFLPVRKTDGSAKWVTLKKVLEPVGNTWRVKKDDEFGPIRDAAINLGSAPCVYRVGTYNPATQTFDSGSFTMTEPVQMFCADLLALQGYGRHLSELTVAEYNKIATAFTGLYSTDRAFTNGTGFPVKDGQTPRKNFVKKQDLDASEYPRFHTALICASIGGATLGGSDQGDGFTLLDHFITVPIVYGVEILNDPRVFYASVIYKDGHLGNFPQMSDIPIDNSYNRVPVPLFANQDLYYFTDRLALV